jgi:hypothetical protein
MFKRRGIFFSSDLDADVPLAVAEEEAVIMAKGRVVEVIILV